MLKRTFFSLLACLWVIPGFAQVTFDPGYFIDASGKKVECLIRNLEWQGSPESVTYKLIASGGEKEFNATEVKEFGVGAYLRYHSAMVLIDTSISARNSTELLSKNKDPEFLYKQVFLKVLTEGRATLYAYRKSNLQRFFFQVGTDTIEPLIFKRYQVWSKNLEPGGPDSVWQVLENTTFRRQLLSRLGCGSLDMGRVNKTDYRLSQLINWVETYNQCFDDETTNYYQLQKKRRDPLNIFIRAGARRNSFFMDGENTNSTDATFEPKVGLRVGVQVEYVLPYFRDKLSIIFEPTYHSYQDEQLVGVFDDPLELTHNSLEFPLGIRYYTFLGASSKVFADVAYCPDLTLGSELLLKGREYLNVNTRPNFIFSLGYCFKNRVQASVQYHTPRNLLNNFLSWDNAYRSVSAILGVNVF